MMVLDDLGYTGDGTTLQEGSIKDGNKNDDSVSMNADDISMGDYPSIARSLGRLLV